MEQAQPDRTVGFHSEMLLEIGSIAKINTHILKNYV